MPQVPLWQKSLISSQLDIDRLDYLRRDSLCSGAEYGNFDCFRIIHTMQLQEYKEKGLTMHFAHLMKLVEESKERGRTKNEKG